MILVYLGEVSTEMHCRFAQSIMRIATFMVWLPTLNSAMMTFGPDDLGQRRNTVYPAFVEMPCQDGFLLLVA